MIEVKLSFATIADMMAHFSCTTQPALSGQPSATITPEKQQAARDSTAPGKAEKAAKAAKPNLETPVEALQQAVEKTEEAKPVRTYEASGIAQKIAKAAAKDKPATIALLEKFNSRDGEGKLTGKALKLEQFDAFEADIDALLAAETVLG
jgi:hypothetical protein